MPRVVDTGERNSPALVLSSILIDEAVAHQCSRFAIRLLMSNVTLG